MHASATDAQPETAPKTGEFSWHELASSVAPSAAFMSAQASAGTAAPTGVISGVRTLLSAPVSGAPAGIRRPHSSQ